VRFFILIFLFLISACSKPENKPIAGPLQEGDIVELNGICDWKTNPKPCPVDNTQKYLRQHIIDKDRFSGGSVPSSLSTNLMISRPSSGFFIDDVIGLKTVHRKGYAGIVWKADDITQVNNEVTLYEITGVKLDAKYKRAMGIKKAWKTHTFFPGCRAEEYRRQHKTGKYKEKVVVLHRSPDLNKEDGQNCSARGHLYFLDIPDNIHEIFYGKAGLGRALLEDDLTLHWQAIEAYLKPENRYTFEPVVNLPNSPAVDLKTCMSLRVSDYEILSVIEQSKSISQNEFKYTYVAPPCVFKGKIKYKGEVRLFEYRPTGFIKLDEDIIRVCRQCTILPDWTKIKEKPANLKTILVTGLASGEFEYGNLIGTQDQILDKIEQDHVDGIYSIILSLDESQLLEKPIIRSRFKKRGVQDLKIFLVKVR